MEIPKYVSEPLRERVLAAAKEQLSAQPISPRAQRKSRKLLAVVVPQFENIFFNHIVIGAENTLTAEDTAC